MATIVWRYGVRVKGTKRRCRKVDWHCESERKGLAETASPDFALALQLAHVWLRTFMKSFVTAEAIITKWTVLDGGMESWSPFSEADNIKIKII